MNITQIRQDCTACQHLLHFNNAGCSLMPDPVMRGLIDYLALEQAMGGYEAAEQEAAAIENFYEATGRLLNASPAEIAYVENATQAWNLAMQALALEPGDEIITGEMEYGSNYLGLLHLARRQRLKLVTLPADGAGCIDPDQLRKHITTNTRAICLTHVPSHRGDIQLAAAIGRVAREHELYYVLDACQSAGQLVLDVEQLQCDFLCASGRKYLRGPRGTGFLYANGDRTAGLEPVFIDLHAATWEARDRYRIRTDARRFENWERSIANKITLGRAIDYAVALGLDNIAARIRLLAGRLRENLVAAGLEVHEKSPDYSGIVTFSKPGVVADVIKRQLQAQGMNISISRPGQAVMELGDNEVGEVCRASVHYFNTEEEVDRFTTALQSI